MIFDRIGMLRALFPARSAAAEVAARWQRAVAREDELLGDVLRLGGLTAQVPDTFDKGVPLGAPIDPLRLAYDAGKRDLALQLAALMALTPTELQSLMES